MSDLAAFLAARLDEDEAAALAAAGGVHCQEWDAAPAGYQEGRVEDGHGDVVVYDEGSPTLAQAAHIARHDPARVLREVAAKRAILALYTEAQAWSYPPADGDDAIREILTLIVGNLAAVHSDHPDYDPEWAPG